jgi:hypothetical protein
MRGVLVHHPVLDDLSVTDGHLVHAERIARPEGVRAMGAPPSGARSLGWRDEDRAPSAIQQSAAGALPARERLGDSPAD